MHAQQIVHLCASLRVLGHEANQLILVLSCCNHALIRCAVVMSVAIATVMQASRVRLPVISEKELTLLRIADASNDNDDMR